ncbi:MAG: T9SS type A sorting domain-containing protein, partial [Bacteroidales bacterium]|nr:T9SS type A sorting domain-containing protein [Bacteroidales bacterium]
NVLPYSAEEITIPLSLKVGQDGEYSISVADNTFCETVDIALQDLETQNIYDLRTTTQLSFNISTGNPDRFLLLINGATGLEENSQEDDGIEIYTYGNKVFIRTEEPAEITVFNLLGQKLSGFHPPCAGLSDFQTTTLSGFSTGFYLVTVKTEKAWVTKKVFIR